MPDELKAGAAPKRARGHISQRVIAPVRRFAVNRLLDLAGLGLIALGLASLLALLSHSAIDPSFSVATGGHPTNWLGHFGSFTSDFLLSRLGAAAPLFVLPWFAWGAWLTFFRHRPEIGRPLWAHCLAWLFGAVFMAMFASALPLPANGGSDGVGVGGLIGDGLLAKISGWVPAGGIWPHVLVGILSLTLGTLAFGYAIGFRRADLAAATRAGFRLSLGGAHVLGASALKPRGARIWCGIANAVSFVGRSRVAAMLDGARVRSLQFLRGKGNFRYLSGHTEESEFLPAALEIVDTPPPPASRAIATLIILFFMLALLWASCGSVDIIATAPGRIVSTGRTKTVQPLDSGVVHKIHVQDGQRVKAGQVLIEIDTTISASERDRLAIDYMQASLDAARLKAASDLSGDPLANFVAPEGATDAQIALQRARLVNQIEEIRARLNGLDQQIAQNMGNLAAVTATIKKLVDSIPYLKKRAEVRGGLAEKGYGSKLDYLTTQQDLVEHQEELKVQRGRLSEAEAAVAALQQERIRAEGEYKRMTLNDLADAEQKSATLRAQLAQASERHRLQTLTAPVDGTVQQLAVHTEGGVVTPAQFLMSIVPADSKVEIEAMISNRDIGFVRDGQDVEVKIDTFNFTRYGLIPGRVQSVSQDSILRNRPTGGSDGARRVGDDTDTGEPPGQELVYSARVSLARTKIQVDDRVVDLTPGMAVTVEIKTGSRRVIAYLLSPFQRHAHGALRER